MIPFLLFTLIKNIKTHGWKQVLFTARSICTKFFSPKILCLIILLTVLVFSLKAQPLELNYRIEKAGEKIGWMKLTRINKGNQCSLSLHSEVSARVLLKFSVQVKEFASFQNGIMQQSSQFQKMNGKTKINKQTILKNGRYVLIKNEEEQLLQVKEVRFNLLCLYFKEPIGIQKVYADNHQQFLDIIKTSDGGYLVTFPNGNSNCYYYEAGVCKKVHIKNKFYSANVILST